mmetsp:Transcript_7764/g.14431  ORF Transcript_7764/g.14431 Transcript_7764/m.14431 type:complete len:147 (+) Transcript_7764:81-521(+)
MGKKSMLAVGSVPQSSDDSSSSGFSGSLLSSSSYRSSVVTSSESSQSEGSSEVILAGVTLRRPESTRGGRKETIWSHYISLQKIYSMKEANMSSLGTLAHASGSCSVCMFHERYATGHFAHPCKCGLLCDRCHADHLRPAFAHDRR